MKLPVKVLSFFLIIFFTVSAEAQRRQLAIGTGFTGSSMHMFGTVLAKHLQSEMRIRVTAQPYIGPSVFIPLVNNGELELGLTSMVDGGTAYAGMDREATPDIRTIARLWTMPFAFMTRQDSDIHTVRDLKGKRVVLNVTAAQAINLMAGAMLEAAGMDENDVEVVTVSGVAQGMEAIVEGNADASPGSLRMGVVRQADANVGIRVLDFKQPDGEERFISQTAPGFTTYDVKADEYPVAETDKKIFAMEIFLMVPKDLDNELVGEILDALHARWPQMQAEFPGLAPSRLEDLVHPTQTFPYHPAAIEYFKSGRGKAKWTEEDEKRNNELLARWP